MIIIAKGQLQHHFWGEYHATIVLLFHSLELAQAAQRLAFPNWKVVTQGALHGLQFHGTRARLNTELTNLYAHKADKNKVNSIRYSIDHGEMFTVEVDLTPPDTTTQPTLEGF